MEQRTEKQRKSAKNSSLYFEEINKVDKILTRSTKKKRENMNRK